MYYSLALQKLLGGVFVSKCSSKKSLLTTTFHPSFAIWHLSIRSYFNNSSLWVIKDHKAILCLQMNPVNSIQKSLL